MMAAVIIIALAFVLWHWLRPEIQAVLSKDDAVTMQFIPLPMIINEAEKDNRLYELLVKKEEARLTLPNVNLDIEPIFISGIALKNLSIDFSYKPETNRVEFQGQSRNAGHIKLSGYYELTSKNNIRYYLNIEDQHKTLIIDSAYRPAYLDNESEHAEIVSGNFELASHDIAKALYGIDSGLKIALKGNFVKKDNFLDIKDLYLKANDLEASVKATLKDKDLSAEIAINEINLDKIVTSLPDGYADRILAKMMQKISDLTINGSINCDKVIVNNTDLRAVLAVLSKKEKTTKDLKLSELKFSLPDNTIFNSHLTISPSLALNGAFDLSNVQASALASILALGDYSGSNLVSVSSRFEGSLNAMKLKDLKISEEPAIATGDLYFFKYASSKMLLGNMAINNYSTEHPSLIQSVLHKNALLSKNYEASLETNKKERFLKDITVKFSDLKTTTATVKSLSARYIETPNSIEFEHLKADDPKFNLEAIVKVTAGKSGPNVSMKFEGDRVDMDIFNDIILKPIMYQDPNIFSFPRFNLATGDITINLKNPDKKAYVSEVNCIAQLNEQALILNNCFVTLFDGQADLNGKIRLGATPGYDISFSNNNIKMNKLTSYLLGDKKKITGRGEANISGTISASGFNTLDEMMKTASGTVKFKSNFIGLTAIDLKSLVYKYGTIKNVATKRASRETEFYNLDGEFDLSNGKLESKNLSFVTKDNIHGKTHLSYGLSDKNTNGVLSLAYFGSTGKIDGFNITFYGDIRKLKTKLGTQTN